MKRVVVLAEDLIWGTRLVRLVQAAGGEAKQAKTLRELDAALVSADHALVDLTARRYDGLAAVERAASQGVHVACVGQHEDVALRGRALAAGASRVFTYNQLHSHGPTLIARWLRPPLPAEAAHPA